MIRMPGTAMRSDPADTRTASRTMCSASPTRQSVTSSILPGHLNADICMEPRLYNSTSEMYG
jgi:hypothetical protein